MKSYLCVSFFNCTILTYDHEIDQISESIISFPPNLNSCDIRINSRSQYLLLLLSYLISQTDKPSFQVSVSHPTQTNLYSDVIFYHSSLNHNVMCIYIQRYSCKSVPYEIFIKDGIRRTRL